MSKKFLETIKVVDGIVHHIEYHQKRLNGVLSHLNTNNTHTLQNILNPPKIGFYRARVVYDKDTIKVDYYPYVKNDVKSLKLVYDNSIDYSFKYLNRSEIDMLFSQKGISDDILIVKNTLITDTSKANIALYDGKNWFTPKIPLLHGTTKNRLVAGGNLIEKDISVNELGNYSKVALMNAMIDFDIIAEENIGEIIC